MKKTLLLAVAGLALLAGCGGSGTVDPDQGAAELGLNRGPQDFAGPAIDAAQAARRLAQDDVAALTKDEGGTWTIGIPKCRRSGPVTSCDIVITGRVKPGGKKLTCSASAAVRIKAERGTAHRTPYARGGAT